MEIEILKQEAKESMANAIEHLVSQLGTIRAGRASTSILNPIMLDYYGTMTPLSQVASITTPDARTILIQPWEKKVIPDIERAIMQANIGLMPQNNGEAVRINVPALTEERRKDLVKQVKSEGETTRISLRNSRRDAIEGFKKLQKEGLSEDVVKNAEADMQKITDDFNKKVDSILEEKEAEIMLV